MDRILKKSKILMGALLASVLLLMVSTVVALAKPQPLKVSQAGRLLSFNDWKRLHIHKARTQYNRFKASKNNNLKESKRLLSRLTYMKSLSFEDYSSVYLVKFKNNPTALKKLAARMDKGEVLILLEKSLKKKNR